MRLSDYCFGDPRLVLVPIEHLHPAGVSRAFAAAAGRRGWTSGHVALFDAAFARYWVRTTAFARATRTWSPPRLRHIAVLREPLAVHPHAQVLNTSAWMLYASDLAPVRSHPEFAAYLLAHGDRTVQTGEVTMAAVLNAAWWFERSDDECAAFAAAARAATRPDAAAFVALADALPWLRELRHETQRPAPGAGHRAIPGSELLVPARHTSAPPRLVNRWAVVARAAADAYATAWRAPDPAAMRALGEWLANAVPPLLITAGADRIVWDPEAPAQVAGLGAALARASGAGVRDVSADLAVLERKTRRFLASLADPAALPPAAASTEQAGYTYLHRRRSLLVYDLDEPGIDRRNGPAPPFARAMLGARAVHEWAHLAVDAGWVPLAALAAQLDAVVTAAPPDVQRATRPDLDALTARAGASPGGALARLLLRRMTDFQANLLAQRHLEPDERETYVRQNVRTLRPDYPPAQLRRMLVRYLYELQYLRFSAVEDRRTFFLRSTWFDPDFFASGVLDEARFDSLAAATARLCDAYAVDESKFVSIPAPDDHPA